MRGAANRLTKLGAAAACLQLLTACLAPARPRIPACAAQWGLALAGSRVDEHRHALVEQIPGMPYKPLSCSVADMQVPSPCERSGPRAHPARLARPCAAAGSQPPAQRATWTRINPQIYYGSQHKQKQGYYDRQCLAQSTAHTQQIVTADDRGHAQTAPPAAARCVLPALRAVGHLAGAAGATGAAALLHGGAVGAALACLRAPPPGAAVMRAEAAWVLGNLAGLPGRCAHVISSWLLCAVLPRSRLVACDAVARRSACQGKRAPRMGAVARDLRLVALPGGHAAEV